MIHSWLALLPPVLVIIGAIVTQRIHISLLIGILTACTVACNGQPLASAKLAISSFWGTATNLDNLYLYGFLLAIGILVSLFSTTGFAISFAHAITKKIRSARQAQYASMSVSLLLFIDDYLSILTTGYVMGPLTDRFNISREKLAFLVHSCAGPIVILFPISSWVAAILSYIEKAGISTTNQETSIRIFADPFFIYLQTIPFTFYSIILILSVLVIVQRAISYGPMKNYEKKQLTIPPAPEPENLPANALDLLLPIVTLVGGIVLGLPFAGGYYLFGGQYTLIESLKYNQHPFLVMLTSAIAAIVVTIARAWYKKVLKPSQFAGVMTEGFWLMMEAITMVYLASTLSNLLANHVETGKYLSSLCSGSLPLFLLPAMFFIVSLACTVAIGSAWGNFGIMIPIAIPMVTSLSGLPLPIDSQSLPLLLPVLGAIFSGSACGNHISPLADTTTMAATSCGIKPIVHAYTQFFYALPVVGSTLFGYIIMGLLIPLVPSWLNVTICLTASTLLCIGTLLFLGRKK